MDLRIMESPQRKRVPATVPSIVHWNPSPSASGFCGGLRHGCPRCEESTEAGPSHTEGGTATTNVAPVLERGSGEVRMSRIVSTCLAGAGCRSILI